MTMNELDVIAAAKNWRVTNTSAAISTDINAIFATDVFGLDAMRQLPNASAPEQAEWLDWVARYADHIDPTVDYKMDTPLKSNPNAKVLYKFTAQGFVDD